MSNTVAHRMGGAFVLVSGLLTGVVLGQPSIDRPNSQMNLKVFVQFGGGGETLCNDPVNGTTIQSYYKIVVKDYDRYYDAPGQLREYAVLQRRVNATNQPGRQVWLPLSNSLEPSSIKVFPRNDGYDLQYTFSNENFIASNAHKNYGSMILYGFDFAQNDPTFTNMRAYGGMQTVPTPFSGTSTLAILMGNYPSDWFSSAVAMGGRMGQPLPNESTSGAPKYNVGISFLGDVMNDKMYTLFDLNRPGSSGNSVQFYAEPNPISNNGNWRFDQADMPSRASTSAPIVTKKFTISVRFMKQTAVPTEPWHPYEYLRTLAPYQQRYYEQFGAGSAVTSREPALRLLMANLNTYNLSTNPASFVSQARVDQTGGWAGMVEQIKKFRGERSTDPLYEKGWHRVMLWAPSGLDTNLSNNYPFKFTSHWTNFSVLMNELGTFRDYAYDASRRGKIGLYWGKTTRTVGTWGSTDDVIMYKPFETGTDQTTAWNRITNEMDRASGTGIGQAGVRFVGLDEVTGTGVPVSAGATQPWEQRQFVKNLQAAYPDVEFAVEPRVSDLVQQLGTMFTPACASNPGDTPMDSPPVLASMLNRGSLISALMRQSGGCGSSSHTTAMAEARGYANLGYGIVMATDLSALTTTDPNFNVAGLALVDANGNPNRDLYVANTLWSRLVPPDVRVPPASCSPADIAWDDGVPLGTAGHVGSNSGVNEGDYNAWFAANGFYHQSQFLSDERVWKFCDIANSSGSVAPRFGGPSDGGPDGVVDEGDYNAFYNAVFSGCI